MPIHFNVNDVAAQRVANGVWRQPLLNGERIPDIKFRLDRIALDAAAQFELSVAGTDLAWFQVLEGELKFRGPQGEHRLTDGHVVFLPPAFKGTLASDAGAAFLLALVPDTVRLDPEFAVKPPAFRVVDWTNEPLLESKHDARKRVYLVTPALFGTQAIKGEMIIYPPRTEAPKHHHVGAAHFMYFLKGGGTAFADDKPFAVRGGDVVYYRDREWHALKSGEDGEMVFSEFFVPAGAKTVWAEPEKACTWMPTGKNIKGGKPSREIREHSMARPETATEL